MKTERKGKFYISRELFEQGWERLTPIFNDMVVVEARFSFDMRAFEFVALCTKFDEVSDGTPAPWYRVECMRNLIGEISKVRWTRQNEKS